MTQDEIAPATRVESNDLVFASSIITDGFAVILCSVFELKFNQHIYIGILIQILIIYIAFQFAVA